MTINELYDIADHENVQISDYRLPVNSSLSLRLENGNCHIAMDYTKIKNTIDEKEKLAHELGHCVQGAFYNTYSKLDIIGKHEYRANVWKVYHLLPFYRLKAALSLYREYWQLAEVLDQSEDFLKMAIEIYKRKGAL